MSNESQDIEQEGEKNIFCGDELLEIADQATEAAVKTQDGKDATLRLVGVIGFTKEQLEKIAKENGGHLPII